MLENERERHEERDLNRRIKTFGLICSTPSMCVLFCEKSGRSEQRKEKGGGGLLILFRLYGNEVK